DASKIDGVHSVDGEGSLTETLTRREAPGEGRICDELYENNSTTLSYKCPDTSSDSSFRLRSGRPVHGPQAEEWTPGHTLGRSLRPDILDCRHLQRRLS